MKLPLIARLLSFAHRGHDELRMLVARVVTRNGTLDRNGNGSGSRAVLVRVEAGF
jgi:hypothetical protein